MLRGGAALPAEQKAHDSAVTSVRYHDAHSAGPGRAAAPWAPQRHRAGVTTTNARRELCRSESFLPHRTRTRTHPHPHPVVSDVCAPQGGCVASVYAAAVYVEYEARMTHTLLTLLSVSTRS